MALLPNTFNTGEGEKLGSFTAIPAGSYLAQIVKSELKDTKNRDGKYLQLVFQIVDGPYVNRQLFARLNLINSNPQTVEIATKTLNTIADDCCGVKSLQDSEQLHGIPMYINVIVKPAEGQYPEQNDIKGYSPYIADGPAPVTAAAATAPAFKPAGAPAAKTPPWGKK